MAVCSDGRRRVVTDFNALDANDRAWVPMAYVGDRSESPHLGEHVVVTDLEGNRCFGAVTEAAQSHVIIQVDLSTWTSDA